MKSQTKRNHIKSDSLIGKIVVGVAIALLASGTSPWWYTAVFRKPQNDLKEARPPALAFASIEPAVGGTWTSDETLEKYARKLREHKTLDSDERDEPYVVSHYYIADLFAEAVRFWGNDEEASRQSEPVFDVTVRNASDDPVVITDVGFEVVMAGRRLPTRGGFEEGEHVPYEIGIFKSYELSFPKLLANFNDHPGRKVWDFRKDPKTVFVKCKSPIVIPPKQLMRYTLQIRDFVWPKLPEDTDMEAPNHALIRLLVVAGDAGVTRSEIIYLIDL